MIPFLKGNKVKFSSYLIKRFFRIYISYFIALIAAILLSQAISRGEVSGFGNYFNQYWNYKLNPLLIISHLIFIGNYESNAFDPVIWSLIHEMRISFIFPLIAYMVIRVNWKISIVTAFSLSLITAFFHFVGIEDSKGYLTAYTDTLHFSSLFIFGALLAKNKDSIVNCYKRLSSKTKWMSLIIAFVLYIYGDLMTNNWIVNDYLITLGACILIGISVSSILVVKVLSFGPFLFLGKISYSLYLYHFIVLLAVVHLFYGTLPIGCLYLFYIIGSLTISIFAWKFVEKPSIKLGRLLSEKQLNKENRIKRVA